MLDYQNFEQAREARLAQEEAEDRYMTETNAIMEEIAFPPMLPLLYTPRDPLTADAWTGINAVNPGAPYDLPKLPLDGYPGPGLKDQVRSIVETQSAFEVIGKEFFGTKDSSMLGASGYERNDRDFYPTPANVTEALCKLLLEKRLIGPCDVIWEPACGDGQMVAVLKEHFAGVLASDICPLPGSDGFEANFLNSTPKAPFTAIITNPPFGEMIDQFMKRALIHLRDNRSQCKLVAFVARHELDCGVKRNKYFRDCEEFAAKITLTWRPRWIADSTGSPRHNYAVYVWVRKELNDPFGPRLYYANNPDKKR